MIYDKDQGRRLATARESDLEVLRSRNADGCEAREFVFNRLSEAESPHRYHGVVYGD